MTVPNATHEYLYILISKETHSVVIPSSSHNSGMLAMIK